MEIWFLIIVSLCVAAFLRAIFTQSNHNQPPGPLNVPIISTLKWLRWSSTEAEAALRALRSKYGPIFTVRRGSRPLIFVSSHTLAYEALVQKGVVFADRPKALPTSKIMTCNQHNISSAGYGPTWRTLRRNLTSQILHPSKIEQYSDARKWVLDILIRNIAQSTESGDGGVVKVMEHFRFAMFCLLVLMCFGDKLDESVIRQIEDVQHKMIASFTRFQILNFFPRVSRFLLRGLWNELFSFRRRQEEVLIPLINSRREITAGENPVTSYVDTLLKMEIQDEDDVDKRKMTEGELVSACSEFLTAGTDTTSTALQWIMANLVKYPGIQSRLFDEIKGVVGAEREEVRETDLSKMAYLKAVVLEGLRRHPPGHFVLPHTVTQEVELGGYTVPKNAVVNFMVADMGWDPKVWEDPMEFKPERFFTTSGGEESFDVTGNREIKMMPFGAGRRICPGLGLAILHLEYFVANLVWNFEWEAVDEVDLSEIQEFTVVMKYPLNARVRPRVKCSG